MASLYIKSKYLRLNEVKTQRLLYAIPECTLQFGLKAHAVWNSLSNVWSDTVVAVAQHLAINKQLCFQTVKQSSYKFLLTGSTSGIQISGVVNIWLAFKNVSKRWQHCFGLHISATH